MNLYPAIDLRGGMCVRLEKGNFSKETVYSKDPGAMALARQAGFEGELHLSTLANVTHQAALNEAARLGASRVILPRELSIDEIREICAAAPQGLDLELFVHGALCYCVSGRCYWSSYLGGKSGLRGRCVQPCRRVYKHKNREGAFFSCLDLSLDLMAKTLLDIPNLSAWKIEGRRKGPHYVYYVTSAYKMLRDNPSDPEVKKAVEDILEMALGRPSTRGRFLPQHEAPVTSPDGRRFRPPTSLPVRNSATSCSDPPGPGSDPATAPVVSPPPPPRSGPASVVSDPPDATASVRAAT